MNIRQELIELCDSQIDFWSKFKRETEEISDADVVNIVLEWRSFFKDNVGAIEKLIDTRMHMEQVENELIIKQELFYEE